MLKKEIENIIKTNCYELSFKKKKYIYYQDLNDNTIGTLAFGIARYGVPHSLFVNVNIGFIYKDINKILIELLGTGYDLLKKGIAMGGISLGYLMPEDKFKEWQFIENTDHSNNINEMFEAIKEYALPCHCRFANIDNFEEALTYRKLVSTITEYIMPIIYYLQGNPQMGIDYINSYIAKYQQKEIDSWNPEIINSISSKNIDSFYLEFIERYKELINRDT